MNIRLWAVLSGVVFGMYCTVNVAAETLVEQSLMRLKSQPAPCYDEMDFIVCADPQPAQMLGTPKVFLDMIQEWNLLRPDFVVCAGDMIMGGPVAEVGPMWDEFLGAVAGLEVPFFPVAGNHDVMDDPDLLEVYEKRVAPLHYAFNYGICQFIILNTEEPGDPDGFSPGQREWLRETLAAGNAQHIFIFLHVPFFVSNWERDWQPTADSIKGYPVRAVFAGHLHHYRDHGEIGGVRYIVAGSAGGGIGTPEEEGGIFCYLAVKVRGEEVSWSVVRPGAVLASDAFTQERVLRMRALRGMLSGEAVHLPWDAPMDSEVYTVLTNPFDVPIETTLTWETPPGWQATPKQLKYPVAPGESVRLATRMKTDGPLRFPTPILTGTVENSELDAPLALAYALEAIPEIRIPRAKGVVTLDGDLSEWAAALPMAMHYGVHCDPADEADLKASARLMWDEQHLYVAVEVEDNEFYQPYYGDVVWMADSVELWVEHSNWSFSLSQRGPQVFSHERPDKHIDSVTDAVALAVHQDGNRVVYEAAFPADELPQIRLEAGEAMHFSVLVNDLDTQGPLEKRHWVELTPGAGAHFVCPMVKLILAPGENK